MKYLTHPLAKLTLIFIVVLVSILTFAFKSNLFTKLPPATQLAAVGASDTDNAPGWTPPIGIPEPSFGIHESYRMYDDQANRNPALTYYQNSEGGYYTHYVDNTITGATDTNNLYGSSTKPRLTIPATLPEGSVVEINNSIAGTNLRYVTTNGSVSKPIFIRGGSSQPLITGGILIKGAYSILENLKIKNGSAEIRPHANSNAHHIAVRSCEIFGDGTSTGGGGIAITGTDGNVFHHIVSYNNHIHHGGDKSSLVENDKHGVAVGSYSEDIWVVDNVIDHMGGDSIQVGGGAVVTSRVYIGRNDFHENRENAVDIKKCQDVVVSQNKMYGFAPVSSSNGEAVAIHYDPSRIWILYNDIHDARYGVISTGSLGLYVIGNVIHNTSYGILWYNTGNVYAINNTVYGSVTGIDATLIVPAVILNNVLTGIIPGASGYVPVVDGYHLKVEGTLAMRGSSVVDNNLFYQTGTSTRISWGGTTYNLAQFQSATGKCAGCLEADPLTAARDAGTTSDVYQTFQNLYGLDIRKDFNGVSRPQGSAWDIGAYESTDVTPPTPEPPAPDPTPATTTPPEPPPPPAPVVHHGGGGGGGGGPAKLKATTTLPTDRAALIQQLQRQLLALLQQLLQLMLARH